MPTCGGHGNCVILRQLSVDKLGRARFKLRGGFDRQGLIAVCNCSDGFFGPLCQATFNSFCANEATNHYEYNGTCTVPSVPSAGAVGQNTPRLGHDSYVGRNFQPATTPAVVPTANPALLSDVTKQNRLAVGFIEFLLEDIIDPSRLASTGASSPLGSPFGAWCSIAPEYGNVATSWIDASPIYGVDQSSRPLLAGDTIGRIDAAAVRARFADRDDGFQVVLNLTLAFHDETVSRIQRFNDPSGPNPISVDLRFEIARYFTGLWLQNIARFHVLPSFFDASIQIPDYDAFITNTAFKSTHYLSQPKLGEIPLAAAVDLLVTLRQGTLFHSDPVCNSTGSSAQLPLDTRMEKIVDYIFTKAPPFGSGPVAPDSPPLASAFVAARTDALTFGLPSFQELSCNLNPTCATPPPVAGSPNALEFFNQVHQTARQAPWTPTELALASAPSNYVSSYPPVAFWLTFGVIRKAYTTDPHRWDVANNNGAFDVWDRSPSNVVRNNIFSTIFNSCNTQFQSNCLDSLNAIRRLINSKDSLQDFLDVLTGGLLVEFCDSFREPLVATELPGINGLGACCNPSANCNFCFT